MNQSAIDRGLFCVTSYRTFSEEEKKRGTYNFESIEVPPFDKRRKDANYGLLDDRGVVRLRTDNFSTYVSKGDVIIGKKLTKITKSSGIEEYIDCSLIIKTGEEGYVDRVIETMTPNGYRLVKVIIRNQRIPEVGDKFASRAAQKGTVGMVYRQEDMPFTATGVVPDLVINSHCIPSRMTINQLMECVLGKSCAMDGTFGDATPFSLNSEEKANKLCERLSQSGFERHGWEDMINGMTGELLTDTKIFIGPTYYQRLKHMVSEKIHCLTGDHEVLTLTGWKNITIITTEDKVATLVNNKLVYENPIDVLSYPDHEGEIYRISNQSIDLAVTSNHRMWVSKPFGRKRTWVPYDFVTAKDIFGKHVKYKKDADWDVDPYQFTLPEIEKRVTPTFSKIIPEKQVSMEDWLLFFGIWYAEGWTKGSATSGAIQIAVNKQRVKDALYPVLDNMGYIYRVKEEKLTIYDYQLYRYMSVLSVYAPNKSLPGWVFKLDKHQCQILITGMLLGDGSSNKTTGCEFYYTSSRILADQFQQLCLHSGWSGIISVHIKKGAETFIKGRKITSGNDVLRISVITTRLNPSVNHGHKQKIHVENMMVEKCPVYCLQVPSQVFYVRRNGKTVWTGNSRAQGHVTTLTRQPLEGALGFPLCYLFYWTIEKIKLNLKFCLLC